MSVGRRRSTLAALAELSVPVDLDDLAAAIVKRELDRAAHDEATIDQIATELHHIHLPKMDRLGVIDYEPDTKRVVSCP